MSSERPDGLQGLKILVIDDSKTIRRTAETLLSKEGCEVFTAVDGFDSGRSRGQIPLNTHVLRHCAMCARCGHVENAENALVNRGYEVVARPDVSSN